MTDSLRREVESLVSALCDGQIEPGQNDRLEHLLRESEECRQVYLQYIDMHARMSVHPNLSAGIPLIQGSEARDDAVVLELAKASLDQFGDATRKSHRRRRLQVAARWLTVSLLVVITLVALSVFDRNSFGNDNPVLRVVSGDVTIQGPGGIRIPRVGDRLVEGETLELGDEARAVLEYDDGTRVVVYFNSSVKVPGDDAHLRLVAGTMEVNAAERPADRPLVFSTDHAKYVVLGTRFRLYREASASRLELDEGKVRLEREIDGKQVDVTAGHVAVATDKPTPIRLEQLSMGRSRLRTTLMKAGQAVEFSEDEQAFVTGHWEKGLKSWPRDGEAPAHAYPAKVGRSAGLAFADSWAVQVNDHARQGMITIWQPGETRGRTVKLPGKSVRSRAIAPDGRHVAESAENGTFLYRLDLARGRRTKVAQLADRGKAWCMSLSEDADFAAAGFWDGTVRVYDLRDSLEKNAPCERYAFETKLNSTPTKIALSRDAGLLAVFARRDGLLLFDLRSGERRTLWAGEAAGASCLKFRRDGLALMAGLNDRTGRMWAVADGSPLIVIDAGHVPRDIAWSSRDSLFVTASNQVKLWECHLP